MSPGTMVWCAANFKSAQAMCRAQKLGLRSITASDLHPRDADNIFVKFVDDTYIISGAAKMRTILRTRSPTCRSKT